MSHRMRLAGICIDCNGEAAEAARFWGAALGMTPKPQASDRYVTLAEGWPYWIVQAVDHPPRVHLDFETDDKDAACARLTALGAREVDRSKGWIVMEAPTGQRFCLVDPDDPEALGREGPVFE